MSRKKPLMGVQPQRQVINDYDTNYDTIKFGRPMEEVLASLRSEPYTTILVEGGVEYSVPAESLRRGAQ